ncbi:uncharacterized protein VTP21DRAFT_8402 [Calcarisporiella thermophila]|uniref:uncharacterized protein n=1 Tax=Calcarisporiella thermophila TaxID=911321 RepID=UPI003743F312
MLTTGEYSVTVGVMNTTSDTKFFRIIKEDIKKKITLSLESITKQPEYDLDWTIPGDFAPGIYHLGTEVTVNGAKESSNIGLSAQR